MVWNAAVAQLSLTICHIQSCRPYLWRFGNCLVLFGTAFVASLAPAVVEILRSPRSSCNSSETVMGPGAACMRDGCFRWNQNGSIGNGMMPRMTAKCGLVFPVNCRNSLRAGEDADDELVRWQELAACRVGTAGEVVMRQEPALMLGGCCWWGGRACLRRSLCRNCPAEASAGTAPAEASAGIAPAEAFA